MFGLLGCLCWRKIAGSELLHATKKNKKMPKYKKTNITAKLGVNYVKNIVEESGCIFHKIEQENDLGIDGIIEFIRDEKPANKSISLQIKSGLSYFNEKNKECIIPVKSHFDYWSKYPLPEFKKGYWVDIKKYFEENGEVSVIKYPANRTNEFDLLNFNRIFIPFNLNEVPVIPLEEALSFFESEHRDEFTLGMVVLFRKYVNQKKVWELFLKMVKQNQAEEIPSSLIYYLAHIPWHPDIWYRGEPISDEIKEYALNEISQFDKDIVIKLISLIDEETGITRGTIGQSIEAIISKVDNINGMLENIMLDESIELSIKHSSALIYAYYKAEKSLAFLSKLKIEESWFIPEIVNQIKEYKWINPYG
jgi:hypothetical protein